MLDVREGARGRGGFESVLEIFGGDIGGVSVRMLEDRGSGRLCDEKIKGNIPISMERTECSSCLVAFSKDFGKFPECKARV